jgi:hypothetical protein
VLTPSVRWQLLLPPVVSAIALLGYIYAFDSQGTISERHSSIGMTILLFIVVSMAAAVEIGALRRVLPRLVKEPNSRSVGSVLCVSVAVAFLALVVWMVIWFA